MSKRQHARYEYHIGYPLPATGTFVLSPMGPGPTLPYPLELRIAWSDDGSLVCVALALGAEDGKTAITSESLRKIPLAQILREISEGDWAGLRAYSGGAVDMGADLARSREAKYEGASRPGRRGHPREFYERIADLYREAQEKSPRHVYRYMAARCYPATDDPSIQRSREATIRKQILKARHKWGLLIDHGGPSR